MRIHCSGIGGIGLSAYASLMKEMGHTVSGSDRASSATTDALQKMGISVSFVQDGSALSDALDLFVYSEAIPDDAPERMEAKRRNVRSLSYFGALGELTAHGRPLVAVAGTHGKSSTTAMAARLCIECGKDPSVVVGTKMTELQGRNWRRGSDLWVVEACEYSRSFLHLSPSILLLTTLDGDHFDAFRDLKDYHAAFRELLERLPVDGVVIGHGGNPMVQDLVRGTQKTFVDADQEPLIELRTPGLHMRQNAQLALALARTLGIGTTQATQALSGFAGTWRRMEQRGTMTTGALIVDDYAHHPAEIRATLSAMKEAYPTKKIACVFQPHTHERTLTFWHDFAKSFEAVDALVLLDVYDARPDRDRVSADVGKLADDIRAQSGVSVARAPTLDAAESIVRAEHCDETWLVVTMGAGNVTQLADRLLR